MFTNNGSTLQTDITTFGVNMKLAHLGRQALMGMMVNGAGCGHER